MLGKIQITKIEAALRQLETAIELWFNEKDPLSIHTLWAASFQIICDLNKKQKTIITMPELIDVICPSEKDALHKILRAPANFLKHADKDHKDSILFSQKVIEYLLFEAVLSYNGLTKTKLTPVLHCFFIWFLIHYPMYFDARYNDIRQGFPVDELENLSRVNFFNHMIHLISQNVVVCGGSSS